MNMMSRAALSLFATLITALSSYSYGEPEKLRGISFSFPYQCSEEKNDKATQAETFCLTGAFPTGLDVVLISKKAKCTAKTAKTFTEDHVSNEFEATQLTATENCFAKDHKNRFDIAVVGIDPSAVHLMPPQNDRSPVSKEVELKARKLVTPKIESPRKIVDMTQVPISLSDAQPKVLRVGKFTLLTFDLNAEGKPWEPGPTAILTGGQVFRLEGTCTYGEPMFFSVNDRPYLTYTATVACCGCGDTNFFVYDLSSGIPKMVYQNSDLSD